MDMRKKSFTFKFSKAFSLHVHAWMCAVDAYPCVRCKCSWVCICGPALAPLYLKGWHWCVVARGAARTPVGGRAPVSSRASSMRSLLSFLSCFYWPDCALERVHEGRRPRHAEECRDLRQHVEVHCESSAQVHAYNNITVMMRLVRLGYSCSSSISFVVVVVVFFA